MSLEIAKSGKYSDVVINFIDNPTTGDIGKLNAINSVKNSVKNSILVEKGEKPFNPFFGSNIRNLLFENFTPVTLSNVRDELRVAIENYEPRVVIDTINVSEITNGFDISITFTILNNKIDDVLENISATITRLR